LGEEGGDCAACSKNEKNSVYDNPLPIPQELVETPLARIVYQLIEQKGGSKKTGWLYFCRNCIKEIGQKVKEREVDIDEYEKQMQELRKSNCQNQHNKPKTNQNASNPTNSNEKNNKNTTIY